MPRLLLPTLAAVGVGTLAMLLFESTATRIVGVLGIFAFIALGVFMIATPEYLSSEDDAD